MPDRLPATTIPASHEPAVKDGTADSKADFLGGFYRQNWLRLHRSLTGLLRNEDDAAEVAQDAFVRMFSVEKPQGLDYPYAYLFRTALNLVKDRAKAQRIRDDHRAQLAADDLGNVELLSPERHVLGREKLRFMAEAIEGLPPRCRRVFVLHKVHHLSHQEISRVLGISRHAVEKHMVRAIARCQAAFEASLQDNRHD